MKVPFLDLQAQHQSLEPELSETIQQVIRESAFIKGKYVREFETAFAEYLGVKNVVGCGNGTDALEIILDALEIGHGDEVIVPALSWISTSEIVATRGAKPVFVDIDSETYCIDAKKVEEKITAKTKAVITVHLYGHPAEMDTLSEISKKHGLFLIEDSAQAHGAEYQGRKIGTIGDAATFSFFPSKNLGCMGDGGAIATDNQELAEKCRAIANHGQKERHHHILHGRNSRLDGLQAAVLSQKLPHLDEWIKGRNDIANFYIQNLEKIEEIQLPKIPKNSKHGFHLFVIQTAQRNELKRHLEHEGVQCLVHYPNSLPVQEVYNIEKAEEKYPIASSITNRIASLPLYPEIPANHLKRVAESIQKFYAEKLIENVH